MTYSPKKMLWLIPANLENDSILNLINKYLVKNNPEKWDTVNHVLYTNSKGFGEFPGKIFQVQNIINSGKLAGSIIERMSDVFFAAYVNGELEAADIIICPHLTMCAWINLFASGGVTKNGQWLRRKPIIYLSPKVPLGEESEVPVGETPYHFFWEFLARSLNIYPVVLENDYEKEILLDEMKKEFPRTEIEKNTHILRFLKFQGFKDQNIQKEDIVVWSGRYKTGKGADWATEIMSLLSGYGIKCRAYLPSLSASDEPKISHIHKNLFEINLNLDPELYVEAQKTAKVCLITSRTESAAIGYFEQMECGCIPVIRKREWVKGFIGSDWPLIFGKKGEAVGMVKDALKNYDYYRDLLGEKQG